MEKNRPGNTSGSLNPTSVFADPDRFPDQDFACLAMFDLGFEIRNIGACIDITEGSREQICRSVWRAVLSEAQRCHHVVQ